MYTHFLTLSVAISVLLNENVGQRNALLPYARDLLGFFVRNAKRFYSDIFTVYNVHNLLHLCDDVENFRCSLNHLSAFPFENHLQTLKKLVRNSNNPISQVAKRLTERRNASTGETKVSSHYKIVTNKERDRCFLTRREEYVFVLDETDAGYFCDVIHNRHVSSFFKQPCDSKLISVALVKSLNCAERKILQKDDLYRKCVCLPFRDGLVCFPLLHGDD